jgi:hypothetical protein
VLPGSGAVEEPDEANALRVLSFALLRTLIADERGGINTRNMRLLTKTYADHPLQPLLPAKAHHRLLRILPGSFRIQGFGPRWAGKVYLLRPMYSSNWQIGLLDL